MHSTIKKVANTRSFLAINNYLRNGLKDHLSEGKTSIQLCLLALAFAIAASAVIIMFRLILNASYDYTELKQMSFSPDYTDYRIYLPLLGALVIWGIAKITSKRYQRMGIAYVMHRYKLHYGKIPLQSAPGQFFQALVALACNFSVGREGPAIHLGAVTASVIAEKFKLPDNCIRIMCASGVAAGIAATFNAPLAAVIFVFEVIVREYRIHYFFPILLAAVCGALSSRLAFGNVHEFEIINVIHIPLDHYPILLIGGLALGCCSAFFNFSLLIVTEKSKPWPLLNKLLLAGLITTTIGFFLPQALGNGELAINAAISEHSGLGLLIALLFAKTIATSCAIGLGVPGGIIGSLYGIGALLGAIIALLSVLIFPESAPYIGLYAVIGMTAMMGVCLSAPLAALVALLELTNDTSIILPAMFVTVPAFLIAYQVFNCRSIFFKQLEIMGLGYKVPPLNLGLQKRGVRSMMNTQFIVMNQNSELLLEVLKRADGRPVLIRKPDEQIHMLQLEVQVDGEDSALSAQPVPLLPDTASIDDAYKLLSPKRAGEVAIYQNNHTNIIGVISWSNLQTEINKGYV
ncbi:chloride channel protein [Parashewanella spongiae]|uniref:Chloride channel protein n=1 Tax=Parashewanella spongiae TaxID=342950 RepID=A0A3A6U0B5_9GAMM|nr:chloride channel protein [Parashewanella spongiae]MCL1079222.1 chloride channel protein [Parashewanella spongiae]RJY07876.1 chloride channel protein [Parashewanella spongiae]